MAHEYYYLGGYLGMARIAGHNSLICMDTRTWEAIGYAQGHPVEPDEISVMLRFLAPGDTFADIGANFGLYSMIASERLGPDGRLFAFEANPHTYQYLRRSAVANRLIWSPNYTFENLAVSDKAGEIEFAFIPDQLGGGHVKSEHDDTNVHSFVSTTSVRLDDYFAPDQTLDFVKIDVEGHELFVLHGMTETISRSPKIRLLLEYFTNSSEVIEYGRGVVGYLRSLGFGLCTVGAKGALSIVPEGEIPTGNHYLLATRTPEADVAAQASTIPIFPKGLKLHETYRTGEHALLTAAGTFEWDAEKNGVVDEPVLFYGPYMDMKAGTYTLDIYGEGVGNAYMEITASFGNKRIADFEVDSWPYRTSFTLEQDVQHFEIVLRKSETMKHIVVSQLKLTRD